MPRALSPEDIRAQIEALRHSHPDVCDDDEMFQLALESETDLPEYMAFIVSSMAEVIAHIEGLDGWIANLTERRRRFERRLDAYRSLAFNLMQAAELKRLELTQATLSVRLGTPKVIITDESALPENVIRIKREPNKVLIKELIEQGVPVAGATLSNAEPVLAVRVK